VAEHRTRATDAHTQPRTARPPAPAPARPGPTAAPVAPLAPALLRDARLTGRGNAPVRQAGLLQMQRTQGNRATRRLAAPLARRAAPPAARPAVQRLIMRDRVPQTQEQVEEILSAEKIMVEPAMKSTLRLMIGSPYQYSMIKVVTAAQGGLRGLNELFRNPPLPASALPTPKPLVPATPPLSSEPSPPPLLSGGRPLSGSSSPLPPVLDSAPVPPPALLPPAPSPVLAPKVIETLKTALRGPMRTHLAGKSVDEIGALLGTPVAQLPESEDWYKLFLGMLELGVISAESVVLRDGAWRWLRDQKDTFIHALQFTPAGRLMTAVAQAPDATILVDLLRAAGGADMQHIQLALTSASGPARARASTVLNELADTRPGSGVLFWAQWGKFALFPATQTRVALALTTNPAALREVLSTVYPTTLVPVLAVLKANPAGWALVREQAQALVARDKIEKDLPAPARQALQGITEFGVNIAAEESRGGVWGPGLHARLQQVLGQLPASHVANNEFIASIRLGEPPEDLARGPLSQASFFSGAPQERVLNVTKPAAKGMSSSMRWMASKLTGAVMDENGVPTDESYLAATKGGHWLRAMEMAINPGYMSPTNSKALFGKGNLLSSEGTTMFDWTILHEMGHAVDAKINFSGTVGRRAEFGGWQTYDSRADAVVAMLAAAGVVGYPDELPAKIDSTLQATADWEARVAKAKEENKPVPAKSSAPPAIKAVLESGANPVGKWVTAQAPAIKTKVNAVVEAVKVGGGGASWMEDNGGGKVLGGRLFHEDQYGSWVSYLAAHRTNRLSNYQFSSPGEWFAEAYAAYYDRNKGLQAELQAKQAALYAWFDFYLGKKREGDEAETLTSAEAMEAVPQRERAIQPEEGTPPPARERSGGRGDPTPPPRVVNDGHLGH